MTSIRHSDTPALERRRELVANELRLIDAEIARRADKTPQVHSARAKIADPFEPLDLRGAGQLPRPLTP